MKHSTTFLLVALLCMLGLDARAAAYDFLVDGVYYQKLSDSTVCVAPKTYYSGYATYSGDVSVPAQVANDDVTYTVVGVDCRAFQNCSELTSVSLPATMEWIGLMSTGKYGNYPFEQCTNLTTITIDADNPYFTTGDASNAVYNKEMTTILACMPGVTGSFTVPETVTTIATDAFENCTGLTSVSLPSGLETIEARSFRGCDGLTEFEIPEGVKTIGKWAFAYCDGLTTATIPASATDITFGVFVGCSALTAISVDAANTAYCSVDGIVYNKDMTTILEVPAGLTGSVTIPSGITEIGDYAFYGSQLSEVVIPEGVTKIGDGAFCGCKNLTSIDLPSTLDSIGDCAFIECTALTSIVLPEGLKYVGSAAFQRCISLTTLTVPSTLETLSDYVFSVCPGLKEVTISEGVKQIEQYAFWQSSLAEITLPASVDSVSYCAFNECDSLMNIYVADGNTNYSSVDGMLCSKDGTTLAIFPCGRITETTRIPEGIQAIGFGAVDGVEIMKTVVLPSTVISLPVDAFHQSFCWVLENIILYSTNAVFDSITTKRHGSNYGTFNIYVPVSALEYYKAQEVLSGQNVQPFWQVSTKLPVAVNGATRYFSTYYSDQATLLSDGVTGYSVIDASASAGAKLRIRRTAAEGTGVATVKQLEGTVLPAGGYLVSTDTPQDTVFIFGTDETPITVEGNMLIGSTTEQAFCASGTYYYVLAEEGGTVGFYYQDTNEWDGNSELSGKSEGEGVLCAANMAVLPVDEANATTSYALEVDTPETWTQINSGTYTYEQFFSGTYSDMPLYVSDKDPNRYKIGNWGYNGEDFIFTWDGDTTVVVEYDQYVGYTFDSYGDVLVGDLTEYTGGTNYGVSYYNKEEGKFYFAVIYYVSAGIFGYGTETFALDDPTDVKTIETETETAAGGPNVWYTLSGVRLGSEAPTAKGIYIVTNGKESRKVLVK